MTFPLMRAVFNRCAARNHNTQTAKVRQIDLLTYVIADNTLYYSITNYVFDTVRYKKHSIHSEYRMPSPETPSCHRRGPP